jgi:hypothetical protein
MIFLFRVTNSRNVDQAVLKCLTDARNVLIRQFLYFTLPFLLKLCNASIKGIGNYLDIDTTVG